MTACIPVRRGSIRARVLMSAAALACAGLSMAAPTRATAAEKITFVLSWEPQAEHCGFYQAKATGAYEKAGLDVELVPGGPSINPAQLVAAGKYDMAAGGALATLNMRASGIPGVTIAAMLQKSPSTMVAHPGQGITKLEDLAGKGIAVATSSRPSLWAWMKYKFNFDDGQLRPYSYNSAAFVADKTRVQQGYITEDAYFLGKAIGAEPVTLLLSDRGYPDYASTIYGMQATLEKRRDAVMKFVDVSSRGWLECATGDPTPAIKAIKAAADTQTEELSQFKINQMRKYDMILGGDAAKLGAGAMTDARWKDIFDTMAGMGALPASLDYKTAYSLDFLSKSGKAGQ